MHACRQPERDVPSKTLGAKGPSDGTRIVRAGGVVSTYGRHGMVGTVWSARHGRRGMVGAVWVEGVRLVGGPPLVLREQRVLLVVCGRLEAHATGVLLPV